MRPSVSEAGRSARSCRPPTLRPEASAGPELLTPAGGRGASRLWDLPCGHPGPCLCGSVKMSPRTAALRPVNRCQMCVVVLVSAPNPPVCAASCWGHRLVPWFTSLTRSRKPEPLEGREGQPGQYPRSSHLARAGVPAECEVRWGAFQSQPSPRPGRSALRPAPVVPRVLLT